jgi:hypothetical protein
LQRRGLLSSRKARQAIGAISAGGRAASVEDVACGYVNFSCRDRRLTASDVPDPFTGKFAGFDPFLFSFSNLIKSNIVLGTRRRGGMPKNQVAVEKRVLSRPGTGNCPKWRTSYGLYLKMTQIDDEWQCSEVYLLQSLGYGTYTVQVNSHLDQLGQNSVAASLFIYAPDQELDNEYSGAGGLIPNPYNTQFVVQPYTIPGNIVRYVQLSTAQFTSQMEWRADHVTFSAWNGWSTVPPTGDLSISGPTQAATFRRPAKSASISTSGY